MKSLYKWGFSNHHPKFRSKCHKISIFIKEIVFGSNLTEMYIDNYFQIDVNNFILVQYINGHWKTYDVLNITGTVCAYYSNTASHMHTNT